MKRAKSPVRTAKRSRLQSLGDTTRKVGKTVKRSAARVLRSIGDATKVMQSRPARRRPAR
jgi:hypothetical protein